MTDLVYQRKSKPVILRDCYYNKRYETWQRNLQRNVGYESLNNKKILAQEYRNKSFKPDDSGLWAFGPTHILNALKSLNLTPYLEGLFYYQGKYHTWKEVLKLEKPVECEC